MLDLKKLFATFKESFECEIGDCGNTALAEYLAERYEEVQATMARLEEIEQEKEELKGKLARDLFKLDDEVKGIQKACPHPSITEQSNDFDGSFKTCDVCNIIF